MTATPTRASRWLRTPEHLEGGGGWRNVFRFAVYRPWDDEYGCDHPGGAFLEYHRDYGDGPEYVDDIAEVDDLDEALRVLAGMGAADFV